jgi:hypothetical protein
MLALKARAYLSGPALQPCMESVCVERFTLFTLSVSLCGTLCWQVQLSIMFPKISNLVCESVYWNALPCSPCLCGTLCWQVQLSITFPKISNLAWSLSVWNALPCSPCLRVCVERSVCGFSCQLRFSKNSSLAWESVCVECFTLFTLCVWNALLACSVVDYVFQKNSSLACESVCVERFTLFTLSESLCGTLCWRVQSSIMFFKN